MKTHKIYTITKGVLLIFLFFVSCNEYLDISPKDKLLEKSVFSSEESVNKALNSIYLGMNDETLYGKSLVWTTLELLAQRYGVGDVRGDKVLFSSYKYNDNTVKSVFAGIWHNAYKTVINANNFIKIVDQGSTPLSLEKKNILLGEAYGLRAFIQFDIFRLFGPVYAQNPNAKSIPYYTDPLGSGTFLPASKVIEKVLADLKKAEELLKNDDPIIANGIAGDSEDNFYKHRNLRFNFYAVKALEARVYLYAGNKQKALEAAKFVIDKASDTFPWVEERSVIGAGNTPDRIFFPEIIFGLNNPDIYNNSEEVFKGINTTGEGASGTNLLANRRAYIIIKSVVSNLYGGEIDYRRRVFFKDAPSYLYLNNGTPILVLSKFGGSDSSDGSTQIQPLIRMSEVYYIAAEASGDVSYLNTVREHRGLRDLPTIVTLEEGLKEEYKKEFWGEGQLFFYYKRKNLLTIPSGEASDQSVEMNSINYVVPIPDGEIKPQKGDGNN